MPLHLEAGHPQRLGHALAPVPLELDRPAHPVMKHPAALRDDVETHDRRDHPARVEDTSQRRGVAKPVLQAYHRGVGAHDRCELTGHPFGVRALHRHEDHLAFRERVHVGLEPNVRGLDAHASSTRCRGQAVRADFVSDALSTHEDDVGGARRSEPSADVAADRAGSEDADSQRLSNVRAPRTSRAA